MSVGGPVPMIDPTPLMVALPLIWAVSSLILSRPWRDRLLWLWLAAMIGAVAWLWRTVAAAGALEHQVGGWDAPLGILLRADGPAVAFIVVSALVATGTAVFASRYLRDEPGDRHFWPLFGFLWGGLNAIWLAGDLFNLYVGLELVSLSAVGLTALAGSAEALAAALRYLLAALMGSLAWLLGVALLYAGHGTLDAALLASTLQPGATAAIALALMTAGLALKTALFPLHGWLPPAHGGALTPVSALLSALVVMASFYVLARVWLQLGPALGAGAPLAGAMQLLGWLGAGALCWGSWQALRQRRLKLVVAWSTVAQIGYFFLLFPLVVGQSADAAELGWQGSLLMVLGHALAKAAMFLAAGNLALAIGSDDVDALAGVSHFLPRSLFSFGLAGVSLMGLPPSAGFTGKWLLMQSALASGQWWWLVVLVLGSVLSVAYIFRIFQKSFIEGPERDWFVHPPLRQDLAALVLALASIALGLGAMPLLALAGLDAAR